MSADWAAAEGACFTDCQHGLLSTPVSPAPIGIADRSVRRITGINAVPAIQSQCVFRCNPSAAARRRCPRRGRPSHVAKQQVMTLVPSEGRAESPTVVV